MSEKNSEFKTNQLDSVQTSLVCLIESEAEQMGNNAHAKRIREACNKLFRWGSATRGQLTAEQRDRLNEMSVEDIIAVIAEQQPIEAV
jgi:hypothetical protein